MLVKLRMNGSHEQLIFRATKDFCSLVSIQISDDSFLGDNKFIEGLGARDEKGRKALFKY